MDLELPGLLVNQQNDETFVAVVKQAFLDADGSLGLGADGLASVDEAALTAAFDAVARAAGIDPAPAGRAVACHGRRPDRRRHPPHVRLRRRPGVHRHRSLPRGRGGPHLARPARQAPLAPHLLVPVWPPGRSAEAGRRGRRWRCSPRTTAPSPTTAPTARWPCTPPAAGPGAASARVAGVAAAPTAPAAAGSSAGTPTPTTPATWAFARDGRLATVAGPASGTVTFAYEGGPPAALTHDGGRRLGLDWDTADPARARIVAVWSTCGRMARYRYDDAGDLVGTERVLGDRLYVLDDRGRILEVWDADGVRLCRNTYDDEGRVVAQVSPFGRRPRSPTTPAGGRSWPTPLGPRQHLRARRGRPARRPGRRRGPPARPPVRRGGPLPGGHRPRRRHHPPADRGRRPGT